MVGWSRGISHLIGLAALTTWAVVGRANAHDTLLRPASPASLFFIAKSENRNQVHYGVHLGPDCAPLGPRPVHAYWRMMERGGAREPLLPGEEGVYGIDDRVEVRRTDGGSRVQFRLRGLPQRRVTVSIARTPSGCTARADTSISGEEAQLHSVYLKLRWPLGVDYALVQGARLSDGTWIVERATVQ